jgi:Fe-S-cluster containining protein
VATNDDNGPIAFFKALESAFAKTISSNRRRPDLIRELSEQAFDSFNGNVAIQTEGLPRLACHRGCASCCTLRVVAAAPEILLIARYIAATKAVFEKIGVDLAARIADEAAITGGLDEKQRMALRRRCPFVMKGVCLIYLVRPLACRGHASYDKRACIDAAAGRGTAETPISEAHLLVRSMVQNALLSALRDAQLGWGLYELTAGAHLATSHPGVEEEWLAGGDPFESASIGGIDFGEMAATFDKIKASDSSLESNSFLALPNKFNRQRE